jgi:hypothetical protein
MNNESRVAIFVDAENLTQWIKLGGLETLLEELSSIGTVVVSVRMIMAFTWAASGWRA